MKNNKIYFYPTDTVWGIGGSIFSEGVYKTIASVKKTSTQKPVSILFGSLLQINDYFDLPAWPTEEVLQKLFNLESTICIPVQALKRPIPPWITQEGSWVGIRCLSYPWIQAMTEECEGPVITTSLNLHHHPPILDFHNALEFAHSLTDQRIFFPPGDIQNFVCSGASSTMIQFNVPELGKWKIIRPGKQLEAIENVLRLHPAPFVSI